MKLLLFLLAATLPGEELPRVKRICVEKLNGGETFGANEKLTRCARIELTPLETVLWTGDNANAHHHPRRQARWSRRVVGGGKIIHAKGVPRFRLPLAAQAR